MTQSDNQQWTTIIQQPLDHEAAIGMIHKHRCEISARLPGEEEASAPQPDDTQRHRRQNPHFASTIVPRSDPLGMTVGLRCGNTGRGPPDSKEPDPARHRSHGTGSTLPVVEERSADLITLAESTNTHDAAQPPARRDAHPTRPEPCMAGRAVPVALSTQPSASIAHIAENAQRGALLGQAPCDDPPVVIPHSPSDASGEIPAGTVEGSLPSSRRSTHEPAVDPHMHERTVAHRDTRSSLGSPGQR